MSKHDATEQALERLSALRASADDGFVAKELSGYLSNRSNMVVAKAAKIASERGLTDLVAQLVSVFDKLMKDPQRLDKRCAAVTELAAALYELDYREPDIYRTGMRHIQMEPSFGPPVDVAAALRGICAQALARTRDPHALEEIVTLLVDAEVPARLGAVKALATNGGAAGALVLRLKALTGDSDPDVMGECFSGLLAARTGHGLEFVAKFADSSDINISEIAILALGGSRLPSAIEFLKDKWERTAERSVRKTLLLALATSRDEGALDFLISVLETSNAGVVCDAISALSVHKTNERVRQAVSSVIDRRREQILIEAFRRDFAE